MPKRNQFLFRAAVLVLGAGAVLQTSPPQKPAILNPAPQPKATGYRGIWYFNQPSKDQYRYKYSGGFATYPQQHVPIAIYSKEADKTFFVYGGTVEGRRELLHMVSYFDHKTGRVPRPTILLNKQTEDAHDNPTLALDGSGRLWVFSNAHGTSRPAYVHRSRKPYSIDEFETVLTTNFSYGQPWYIADKGFLFLHTRYAEGRKLFFMTSPDGAQWSEPTPLAAIGMGHYQISWPNGSRVGTVMDFHPEPVGLNNRTNIYYLETRDMGRTWTNVSGQRVSLPLTEEKNAALVRHYRAEKLLVYLKDLQFDESGHPVVLYQTSKGYESGPKNGKRVWWTARWNGGEWVYRPITTSDHNYDHGSLYLEAGGTWRVIAPTDPGPQPWGTGGEMVMWTSQDRGETWKRARTLTRHSKRNHTYARRPMNAHPAFYAIWADGDAFAPSESNLYFTDRQGSHVWRLPGIMRSDFEKPEVAW